MSWSRAGGARWGMWPARLEGQGRGWGGRWLAVGEVDGGGAGCRVGDVECWLVLSRWWVDRCGGWRMSEGSCQGVSRTCVGVRGL